MVRPLAFVMSADLVGHLALVPERVADPALDVHRILGHCRGRGESIGELKQLLKVFAREPCLVPQG